MRSEGSAGRELWFTHLGLKPYAEVLELQRAAARARLSGELPQDLLILVEHPPVVTLGRSARNPEHLSASPELLRARGVELFEVERGGDVTFHGPGQLVGYPIIDLKRHRQDLHWYLRQVEEALIRALAPFGNNAMLCNCACPAWTIRPFALVKRKATSKPAPRPQRSDRATKA